jgi:cell fate (sporulation/competence/biofilm development) regulator YmcA (YheA/YmcA/DUF963 family)
MDQLLLKKIPAPMLQKQVQIIPQKIHIFQISKHQKAISNYQIIQQSWYHQANPSEIYSISDQIKTTPINTNIQQFNGSKEEKYK